MSFKLRMREALIRQRVAVLLLVILVAAFAVLIVGARSMKTQVDALSFADSDNLGWNISQLDVDYQGFAVALLDPLTEASEGGTQVTPEEMESVRLAFDVFYSRVSVVKATLRRVGVSEEVMNRLEEVIVFRNAVADEMDAIQDPSATAIASLLEATNLLGDDIRSLTTAGIQALSQMSADARETEHQIFLTFNLKLYIILGFVLLSCLLAIRLWSDLEKRNRSIEKAATNVTNAVETALSAVIFLSKKGMILQCNKAAETHFGSSREDLIGVDFVHAFIDRDSLPKFCAYQDSKDTTPIRLTARTVDYRAFPMEMSGSWQKDIEGNDIYIVYLLDISEQLEAEEKLKASRDEAKEASHAKSRFLAIMSHEMRTPLHGLIASMDMIETSSLTEPDQRLFSTARECSTRALEQVNSILDHTRTTQMAETERPFRPQRVIGDIRDSLTPLASANGNTIDFSFSGDGVDARFVGMPDSFSRVMYNLVGNAIKFTKNGSILIEMIATQGRTADARSLTFVVKDTGSGIADEDQTRIFEQFETATSFADDGAKGTGLGLSIVKHSLDQMNSQIELRSALGKGSRFSFSLHLDMMPSEGESVEKAAPKAGAVERDREAVAASVLIVDDNEVNRIVLREMVSRLGFAPECVTSGFDAVDAAEKTAYDLILMDINMPGMSGHDATRNIRASKGKCANTVILGVTALIPNDHDKPTDSGMNAMLAKPLTSDRLLAATKKYLSVSAASEEDSLIGLLDADTARALKAQSLDDAQQALKIMLDPSTNWDARVDKIHYAVGSTAVVGFNSLSQFLAQAESAAKRQDQAALDACAAQIRSTITQ